MIGLGQVGKEDSIMSVEYCVVVYVGSGVKNVCQFTYEFEDVYNYANFHVSYGSEGSQYVLNIFLDPLTTVNSQIFQPILY